MEVWRNFLVVFATTGCAERKAVSEYLQIMTNFEKIWRPRIEFFKFCLGDLFLFRNKNGWIWQDCYGSFLETFGKTDFFKSDDTNGVCKTRNSFFYFTAPQIHQWAYSMDTWKMSCEFCRHHTYIDSDLLKRSVFPKVSRQLPYLFTFFLVLRLYNSIGEIFSGVFYIIGDFCFSPDKNRKTSMYRSR